MRTAFTIIYLMVSSPVLALDVSYPFPPLRFSLRIARDSVSYQSEGGRRELLSKDCHRPVIQRFVGELFQNLPQKKEKARLHVIVDAKKISFSPRSEIHGYLENMDARIIRLQLEAKSACP